MAIDNSLHDSLKHTYFEIKNYLETTQLTPQHSQIIIKHEELATLLENLDIEAMEEQSNDIHLLHKQLSDIKEISTKITQKLDSDIASSKSTIGIENDLDKIFIELSSLLT